MREEKNRGDPKGAADSLREPGERKCSLAPPLLSSGSCRKMFAHSTKKWFHLEMALSALPRKTRSFALR